MLPTHELICTSGPSLPFMSIKAPSERNQLTQRQARSNREGQSNALRQQRPSSQVTVDDKAWSQRCSMVSANDLPDRIVLISGIPLPAA